MSYHPDSPQHPRPSQRPAPQRPAPQRRQAAPPRYEPDPQHDRGQGGPQRRPPGAVPPGGSTGPGAQRPQGRRARQSQDVEQTEKLRANPPGRPAPGAEVAAWRPGELAAPVQAPTGLAMKRRHPVAAWLGLPLITLGIYSLVWYYKIHREMAEFDPRRDVPVAGPLLVLLFLSWTVVAPLVSFFNTGRRIADAQRSAGLPATCSPVIGLLLCFLLGLQTLYYQVELNKIVEAYDVPERTRIVLAG